MAWYGNMVYISVKDLNNYKELFTNAVVLPTVLQTIKICLPVAVLVTAISYIMAFFAYAYIPHFIGPFLALLLLPYVSSYYVILLGWRAWVGEDGLLNRLPVLGSLADTLSYGIPSLIIVMILRYLPLSVLLVYVRLRALPVTQIHVARNLGLTCAGIHYRLYLRWCRPVLVMVGVFSFIFASLDYLASSVVGGGSVQTLANLIDDWQRAQAFQGPAMALGVFYASVLTVLAFLTMCFLSLRVGQVSETSQSEDRLSFGGVEGWLVSGITLIVMVVQLMMILGIFYLALGGLEGAFPTIKPFLSFLTDDELKHAFFAQPADRCGRGYRERCVERILALRETYPRQPFACRRSRWSYEHRLLYACSRQCGAIDAVGDSTLTGRDCCKCVSREGASLFWFHTLNHSRSHNSI
jgi:putative spermidine/putrescine transport system permease protein/spermidine/putrescine transport system permease protein